MTITIAVTRHTVVVVFHVQVRTVCFVESDDCSGITIAEDTAILLFVVDELDQSTQ